MIGVEQLPAASNPIDALIRSTLPDAVQVAAGKPGSDPRRSSHPTALAGRYRLTSEIGSGGMGVVYRAVDTRLDRTVAIKALRDNHGRGRGRLRSEALAAASLDHPYVCRVFDVVDDGKDDYLVMEFVEGETLASILRRGCLSVDRTVEIGLEILEGLASAHARGLVHRDIKPANVMVTASGHVKLLDFGLAQVVTGPDDATRTSPSGGDHAGTPYYMAPEQAVGHLVTARADLFSVGVVLFECLTGRLPFEGKSGYDYARHLLSDRPLSVLQLVPGCPLVLARLIDCCLKKKPANRPDSAVLLLEQLRRARESLSVGDDEPESAPNASSLAILGIAAVAALALAWKSRVPH